MNRKIVEAAYKDRIRSTSLATPKIPSYKVTEGDTSHIPSNFDGPMNTFKTEPMKYTGTFVIGIATMHKSNAVPITSQEAAEDIAKMRRN